MCVCVCVCDCMCVCVFLCLCVCACVSVYIYQTSFIRKNSDSFVFPHLPFLWRGKLKIKKIFRI